MGCFIGLPQPPTTTDVAYNRLCKYAKQTLLPVSGLDTDKSFFFRDTRSNLWKLSKHRYVAEATEMYYNNMRAFLLPETHFMLKPAAIQKLTVRAFGMKMRQGSTDMYDFMDEHFDPEGVSKALHDVSEAIHWLHDRRLAHRDIKPENIVLHNGRWKLIDFDFCSPLEQFVHCGTEHFVCPHSVTKDWPGSKSDSSRRADVYAFGKMILMALWKAGTDGLMKQRRVIWVMFHKSCVADIPMHIEPAWQPWLDIAMTCCAKVPPVQIPTLPATMENTLGTIDSGTAVATMQMVNADDIFA
mgnify:CR=1 FL=1